MKMSDIAKELNDCQVMLNNIGIKYVKSGVEESSEYFDKINSILSNEFRGIKQNQKLSNSDLIQLIHFIVVKTLEEEKQKEAK